MKKFLTLLVLLTPLTFAFEKACADPFDSHVDKVAHFGASALLVESSMRWYSFIEEEPKITWTNRVVSSALTFGIGIAKELYDKRRGGDFSGADLAADGLGVVTGNLLFWEF